MRTIARPSSGTHADQSDGQALAPEIAVNCVAPGMIDLGERSAAAFMKKMAAETPMQRNGKGERLPPRPLLCDGPALHYGQICRSMAGWDCDHVWGGRSCPPP